MKRQQQRTPNIAAQAPGWWRLAGFSSLHEAMSAQARIDQDNRQGQMIASLFSKARLKA